MTKKQHRPLPEEHRKPWTEKDDRQLEFCWGVFKLKTIAKRLRRTEWAIVQRAHHLKLGPWSRGTVSLREFERLSGFSYVKIYQAARVLGIELERVVVGSEAREGAPKRRLAIDEEQQEKLLELMLREPVIYANKPGAGKTTRGVWGIGRKPPACLGHGGSDRPHFAKGKCKSCYAQQFKAKSHKTQIES